jgi:uncharacterized Fe-S cluster-containing MiaB family protein
VAFCNVLDQILSKHFFYQTGGVKKFASGSFLNPAIEVLEKSHTSVGRDSLYCTVIETCFKSEQNIYVIHSHNLL